MPRVAVGVAPNVDSVTSAGLSWNTNSRLGYGASQLELQVDGGVSAALLRDVSAFEIQTFDESDTALAASLAGVQCNPIRRIRITLTVTRFGVSVTLRTKVFIRSTMSGAEL